MTWKRIGLANNVVAMTALNGTLFAVTKDDTLWWREPTGYDMTWKHMGQANNVVAPAAAGGKLEEEIGYL